MPATEQALLYSFVFSGPIIVVVAWIAALGIEAYSRLGRD